MGRNSTGMGDLPGSPGAASIFWKFRNDFASLEKIRVRKKINDKEGSEALIEGEEGIQGQKIAQKIKMDLDQ